MEAKINKVGPNEILKKGKLKTFEIGKNLEATIVKAINNALNVIFKTGFILKTENTIFLLTHLQTVLQTLRYL